MSPYIHSNLNRKGNEGFPRKMKQLSNLHIWKAAEASFTHLSRLVRHFVDREAAVQRINQMLEYPKRT